MQDLHEVTPRLDKKGEDGVGFIVGFHDGTVTGVKAMRDRSMALWCSTPGDKEYQIVFPGVRALVMTSFRGANIINAILLYEARSCPRDLFARVWGLDSPAHASILASKYAAFVKSNANMLEVGTSDGCEILAELEGDGISIQIKQVLAT
jgi:hypothetical protein